MKKLTIAEKREWAIDRLVTRKAYPTTADWNQARKIMNSYYRLVGLCGRLLALDNTNSVYNAKESESMSKRASAWFDRLNKQFAEFDAELTYFGWYPDIVKKGTTQDLYLTYFYD